MYQTNCAISFLSLTVIRIGVFDPKFIFKNAGGRSERDTMFFYVPGVFIFIPDEGKLVEGKERIRHFIHLPSKGMIVEEA